MVGRSDVDGNHPHSEKKRSGFELDGVHYIPFPSLQAKSSAADLSCMG
ncbi:MAG: hypothetical protein K6G85_00685 [Eubacterium sp.]|nr:hypothetical protein [Eubacterium sp.]